MRPHALLLALGLIAAAAAPSRALQQCEGPCDPVVPPPPAPSIQTSCSGSSPIASISWSNAFPGSDVAIDLDDDGNWGNGYWYKDVGSSVFNTGAPGGFVPWGGASGAPNFSAGRSIQARAYYYSSDELSGQRSATLPSCAPAPPAAPALTASAASSSEASLSWTHPGADSFLVTRDGAQIASLGAAARAYTASGLTSGQTYSFRVAAVNAGGQTASNAVSVTLPSNGAAFVSQSVPTAMTTGQTANVSVTFRNTGTLVWRGGAWGAGVHILGSQNPQDNQTWGVGRVDLGFNEQIAPGAQKTFTFAISAPPVPGTYNFQWRMLQEQVEWFGALSPNVSVVVSAPPAAPPTVTPSCSNGAAVARIAWSGQAGSQTEVHVDEDTNVQFGYMKVVAAGVSETTAPGGFYNYPDMPVTPPNFAPGVRYYARVKHLATGALSPNTGFDAPDCRPAAISLTATASSRTQISLSWSFTGSATSVKVLRDGALIATLAGTARAHVDSGLASGAQHSYKVVATNASGDSESNVVSARTLFVDAGYVSHSVPSSMTAGQAQQVTVTMSNTGSVAWQPSAQRLISTVGGHWGVSAADVPASVAPGQSHAFVFTVTAPATPGSYSFQWRMQESGAWFGQIMPPLTIAVGAAAPPAPTGFTAAARSTTKIALSWNGAPGASGYALTRLGDNVTVNLASNITAYEDAGRVPATAYSYRLVATNAAGSSPAATASATTFGPIPAPTAAPSCSGAQSVATISWTNARPGSAFAVDLDDDGNWANGYWYKDVAAGQLSTLAPGGFQAYGGATGAPNFSAGRVLQTRVYYYSSDELSAPQSFAASDCRVADTTPPTAVLTSPADGATVSGVVTMTATASDNVGVARVDFSVDGTVVGSDASAPYTFAWDSASLPDASRSLRAKAFDAAGLSSLSNAVSVTVRNTAAEVNGAQFVSQSVPTALSTGERRAVSITFKNSGSKVWRGGPWGPGVHILGSRIAPNDVVWGPGRVDLALNDAIAPGQQKTFAFEIVAPQTPGTYGFKWQMLQEAVEWFGAESPNVDIVVTQPAAPAPTVTMSCSSGAAVARITWTQAGQPQGTSRLYLDESGIYGSMKQVAAGVLQTNAPEGFYTFPDMPADTPAFEANSTHRVRVKYEASGVFTPATSFTAGTCMTITSGPSVSLAGSTATVSWTTNAPGTGQVDFGPTAQLGRAAFTPGTPAASQQAVLTGLTPNTTYHYRVNAFASRGQTARSAVLTFFVPAAPAAPAITDRRANNVTKNSAAISWNTNMPAVGGLQYQIENSTYSTLVSVDPTPRTAHSGLLNGLLPATTYFARVSAFAAGTTVYAMVGFVTLPDPQPAPVISNASAQQITMNRATIVFTTDINATSRVEFTKAGGTTQTVLVAQTPTTFHQGDLNQLTPDSSYTFRAFATANGKTTTADGSFRTLPPPPLTIAIVSPAEGARLIGAATLKVQVSVYEATEAEFFLDGASIGKTTTRPCHTNPQCALQFVMNWDAASVPAGAHVLTAKTIDSFGRNAASAPVNILTGPLASIVITAPQNGAVVAQSVEVRGAVTDYANLQSVEISVDGTPLATLPKCQ